MAVLASDDWFEVVDHDPFELHQGDIVEGVQVPNPDAMYDRPDAAIEVKTFGYTVILSQDCDLIAAQGNRFALLCPAFTFAELGRQRQNVRDVWDKARKQQLVHFFALPPCSVKGWDCSPLLVDFRQVYQLSLERVEILCRARSARVRLRPPYRYEIGRRFGQKLTRIGLDQPLPEWKEVQAFRESPPER